MWWGPPGTPFPPTYLVSRVRECRDQSLQSLLGLGLHQAELLLILFLGRGWGREWGKGSVQPQSFKAA